jgi:UPF0716 family protein affecting phage T7 exclusion
VSGFSYRGSPLTGQIISLPPQYKPILADRHQSAYTPAMTLKNAAFMALVGMILATLLLVAGFIGDVVGVVRGLIPAVRLLTSFIYAFAGLSVVVFLYAFHKAQS